MLRLLLELRRAGLKSVSKSNLTLFVSQVNLFSFNYITVKVSERARARDGSCLPHRSARVSRQVGPRFT